MPLSTVLAKVATEADKKEAPILPMNKIWNNKRNQLTYHDTPEAPFANMD